MKLAYPDLNKVIELQSDKLNSLVIENPVLLYDFILDMKIQLNKKEGKLVLSLNDELLSIHKSIELFTDVYGIDLNTKSILTRINEELAQKAVNENYYDRTMQLVAELERYFSDLTWDMDYEVECEAITPKQLMKAFTFNIVGDGSSLAEHILKYIELVRSFFGEKLFVFVNFRGFIKEEVFQNLSETLIQHEFYVLFIDNKEYPLVKNENRWTIDIDLCEF